MRILAIILNIPLLILIVTMYILDPVYQAYWPWMVLFGLVPVVNLFALFSGKPLMRILAVILNVPLLIHIVTLNISEPTYWEDWPWKILFGLVPVVSVCALFFGKPLFERGWIHLYFKRKAIEEQAKIDALKKTDADR